MIMDLPWQSVLAIFTAITIAYVIFGMAGFGTALIASPVLANFIPVAKIVPLLALLDMLAALANLARNGRKADTAELKRLIPMMVAGSLLGAVILLKTRPDVLLLALGAFIVCYSLYSLSGLAPIQQFTPRAAIPFGFSGGIFSALFGSGGFIYAIYLAGRIEKKENLRITQTTLIGCSTLTRVVLFALAGVYFDSALLALAVTLLPAMALGLFTGRHITLRLSRAQFIKAINVVVLASGIALLFRYFNH